MSNSPESAFIQLRPLFDLLRCPCAEISTNTLECEWSNNAWKNLDIQLQDEGSGDTPLIDQLSNQLINFGTGTGTFSCQIAHPNGTVAEYETSVQHSAPSKERSSWMVILTPTGQTQGDQAPEDRDTLTGLPGRATLMARLETYFDSTTLSPPFGLIFLDLDDFKQINDSNGHLLGDQVLQEVASRLSDALRTDDLIVRYGGDEFVAIVVGVAENNELKQVVRRLEDSLNAPFMVAGEKVRLSISLGVAQSGENWATPMQMIDQADRRMYQAKQQRSGNQDL
ncbi:GGDEF domain-containing protein [Aeoliella mucimassa]|uniref:Putative diguanylate cyclase YfiN n=1 Tax=Aeoliella mucimassa TaxID=2527972 RepID=A0A518AMX1_9BACT|nr:GGDEF domain-containing protein [Aeoliella mucimassa]QDU56074.1 putative diguanylate cyclase YfiN [Aeoliella mucimassa]